MDNKTITADPTPNNNTQVMNKYRPPVQPVISPINHEPEASQARQTSSLQAVQSKEQFNDPPQISSTYSTLENQSTTGMAGQTAKSTPILQQTTSESTRQQQITAQNGTNQPTIIPQTPLENQQPLIQGQTPSQMRPLLSPDVQTPNFDVSGVSSVIEQKNEPAKQQSTPHKTAVTKVKLSDELNLFDWFRATDIINQIAEKARNSVDSVITTLDPGMKEYLYSGGNINIVVISDNEAIVSSVRDSFQNVFGRATVTSDRQSAPSVATKINQDYPIKLACGLSHALSVARDKIKKLRSDTSCVPQNQVVLAIQPALVQLQEEESVQQSDKTQEVTKVETSSVREVVAHNWFLTYCMIVEDPVLNATLHTYSQFIPIDTSILAAAKSAKYSEDSSDGQSGFLKSIDELMAAPMNLANNSSEDSREDWLRVWSGLEEREIARELSLVLAHTYRRKWNDCVTTT